MKKYCITMIVALLSAIQMRAQSSELFPRYTVVDVAPEVTGDKSLEEIQNEYQKQADKSLNGKVRVDFLILPSGAIGDCRINYTYPGGNEDLAYEGRKFVSLLPRFTPGVLNGENVRTWKYVVLRFGDYQEDPVSYESTLGPIKMRDVSKNNEVMNEKEESVAIDHMPSFPGGAYALIKYLSENIKYPDDCYKQKIEGKVLVEFVVEANGSISSIDVKKSVHPQLDAEAVRVIEIMPRWFPAMINDQPVRVKYTVPISFRL